MIVCVCRNLNEKTIAEYKTKFGKGYIAVLAKENCKLNCCACVRYLKKKEKRYEK